MRFEGQFYFLCAVFYCLDGQSSLEVRERLHRHLPVGAEGGVVLLRAIFESAR